MRSLLWLLVLFALPAHADPFGDCFRTGMDLLPIDISSMRLLYRCEGNTPSGEQQILCVFRDSQGGVYAQNRNTVTLGYDTLDFMRFERGQVHELLGGLVARYTNREVNQTEKAVTRQRLAILGSSGWLSASDYLKDYDSGQVETNEKRQYRYTCRKQGVNP